MNPGPGLRWLDALGPQKIRPGLARTRALLAALGNPQASFRVLLVGGTNGKGSAAAAAASILDAAGLRVGLTTSPHLVRVTERVRLCGRDVSEAQLDAALRLVAAVSGEDALRPTYFEALVVAACELFRRARVSVGVVEVGIGGRLDATNVLDPEVSVVTNVEEDHLETLGPSLADVAREKAGIFRRGQPALTAATGVGLGVLRTEAGRAGARLLEISPSPAWDDVSPLPGAHQRANLALAVAAARAFAPLDGATVRRGIAAIRWPGRLQTVPRPGLRPLLVDGAHNPAGAAALADYLDAAGPVGADRPRLRRPRRQGLRGDVRSPGLARPPRRPRRPRLAPCHSAGRPRRAPRAAGAPARRLAGGRPRGPRKKRGATHLYSWPGRSSSPAKSWRSSSPGSS